MYKTSDYASKWQQKKQERGQTSDIQISPKKALKTTLSKTPEMGG